MVNEKGVNSRDLAPIVHLSTKQQNIVFNDEESEDTAKINSENVTISLKSFFSKKFTNKIVFREIIHHSWEKKFYYGRQVDVTIDNKFLAYVVQQDNKTIGVRVTEVESGEKYLIKVPSGDEIIDIAFASHPKVFRLAFINRDAKVSLYQIKMNNGNIDVKLLASITHKKLTNYTVKFLKIIWCPYDSACDNTQCCNLFSVIVGNNAYIYDTEIIRSLIEVDAVSLLKGTHVIKNLPSEITSAVFSPDASTLAITCFNGYVKFYQFEVGKDKDTKCLHTWNPHGSQPVFNLFFLDGPFVDNEEPTCWAYALTVTDSNEMKLWACTNWKCIQTIKFQSDEKLELIVNLDSSSEFIFVSDLTYNRLFVLHFEKTLEKCYIHLIHQYFLKDPILSICISKIIFQNEDLMYDNDEKVDTTVLLRFYCIEPQNCRFGELAMQISCSPNDETKFITYDDSIMDSFNESSFLADNGCLNLMTPDDFNIGLKPMKDEPENDIVPNDDIKNKKTELVDFTSGSSSPSREVVEIFGVKNENGDSNESKQIENLNEKESSWSDIPIMKSNVIIETEKYRLDQNTEIAIGNDVKNNQTILEFEKFNGLLQIIEKQNNIIKTLTDNLEKTNKRLSESENLFEKKFEALNNKMIDRVISFISRREKKNIDDIKQIVKDLLKSEYLNINPQLLNDKMVNPIKGIVEKCINTAINTENIRKNLQIEVTNKINNLDKSLRDQIPKMLSSKAFVSSLTASINVPMKQNIDSMFKNELINKLIPMIDEICSNMFEQIHSTFEQGTREYIAVINKKIEDVDSVRKSSENTVSVIEKSINEIIQKSLNEMFLNIQKDMKSTNSELETSLLKNFKETIKIHSSNNVSVVENSSKWSITSQKIMEDIQKALSAEDYNLAFHLALASSDISLVNYVCERVLPEQLFGKNGCGLKPNVLLALIQQLSADLNHQTNLKLKYLEDALSSFDLTGMKKQINKKSLEHAMEQVINMLVQYRNAHRDSLYASQINRVLIMIRYYRYNM